MVDSKLVENLISSLIFSVLLNFLFGYLLLYTAKRNGELWDKMKEIHKLSTPPKKPTPPKPVEDIRKKLKFKIYE